jgi:hypothetical protein
VEGIWRYGEHTGGAASARHTATGKSVGRTHHWCGERRVSGYRKFGGASPPPAGGPYGARRPKSQRGEHTAGVASGWRVATGKSTEQVYRQGGTGWRAEIEKSTGQAHRRHGEQMGGAVSGWHAPTGKSVGQAHRRRGTRIARGLKESGTASRWTIVGWIMSDRSSESA